ncbi:cytochrome C [Blastopirellula marina]|uniref:Cytochrome C n=1 Tax=Blastopirellula marina TaxID=124 RepID=A0A2S8F2K0_9BACT|nr:MULTISPECIES: c-type cytochrome [Pirellulaceae]PQO26391.1 cytochrome C [Blastopirellula marina]RCS44847.1 cytochrome C [Bremerella cremea]
MNILTLIAQMPTPRDLPLPLPIDELTLRALLVPLFLLHILFVNLMVGGTILAVVYEVLGYSKREPKFDRLAEQIAVSVTVNKSLAVVLGVGPLLMINLLYTLTFYSSNSLTGHAWILIVPLVTAAFLLTYVHKYTWEKWHAGGLKLLHMGVGICSMVLFLSTPFIFLANINLMQYPDRWYDVQGFFSSLTIGNGNVFFRYLHFLAASVAVTALFLCIWLTFGKQADERLPKGFTVPTTRRHFYRLTYYITMAQFLVGPVLLLILPHVGMNAYVVVPILIGACLGIGLLWLLKLEIHADDARIGRLWAPIFLVFTVVALSMGIGRQMYRDVALKDFNDAVRKRTVAFREEVAGFNAVLASTGGHEMNGEQLYKMVCSSCHQVELEKTAPSIQEIYRLHKDHPEKIVQWAMHPGKKRQQFGQMPSMAHIGEEKLALVANYMLELGSGEKEFVVDESQWIRNLPREEAFARTMELPGVPQEGELLFTTQTCVSCHVSQNGKPTVGPDLKGVGKRLSRERIVESILDPSAEIAKGYETWSVLTWEGIVHTGLITEQNEAEGTITIRLADGKEVELIEDDLDAKSQQSQSQMPNGVVDNITPEQLTDLVAYVMQL